MILTSFFAAVGQLDDRHFRRVLLLGIALTVTLLIAAGAALLWWIGWMTEGPFVLPLIGEVRWLSDFLSWGSVLIWGGMSIILMVPVASAMTSLFLDDVAQAVEDKHYPDLPEVPRISFWDALRDTVNFLGVMLGANVLALILYAMVLWIPFAPFLVFWALNGFLLGREYFTLAAMRRVGRVRAKELRKQHQGKIWWAGILMAMPLSVPLLNLFIPILGAATFTHLYHHLTGSAINRG